MVEAEDVLAPSAEDQDIDASPDLDVSSDHHALCMPNSSHLALQVPKDGLSQSKNILMLISGCDLPADHYVDFDGTESTGMVGAHRNPATVIWYVPSLLSSSNMRFMADGILGKKPTVFLLVRWGRPCAR